jgi:hypothetical protein
MSEDGGWAEGMSPSLNQAGQFLPQSLFAVLVSNRSEPAIAGET